MTDVDSGVDTTSTRDPSDSIVSVASTTNADPQIDDGGQDDSIGPSGDVDLGSERTGSGSMSISDISTTPPPLLRKINATIQTSPPRLLRTRNQAQRENEADMDASKSRLMSSRTLFFAVAVPPLLIYILGLYTVMTALLKNESFMFTNPINGNPWLNTIWVGLFAMMCVILFLMFMFKKPYPDFTGAYGARMRFANVDRQHTKDVQNGLKYTARFIDVAILTILITSAVTSMQDYASIVWWTVCVFLLIVSVIYIFCIVHGFKLYQESLSLKLP